MDSIKEYVLSAFFQVGFLVGITVVYILWVISNRRYGAQLAARRREQDALLAEAATLRENFDQKVHEAQLQVAGEVNVLRQQVTAEQQERARLQAALDATGRPSTGGDPGEVFQLHQQIQAESQRRSAVEALLAEKDHLLADERIRLQNAQELADAARVEAELLRSELNSKPAEVMVAAVAPVAPVAPALSAEAIAPLYDAINRLQQQTSELESRRSAAHDDLARKIDNVAKNATAPFKLPEARLNWGSMTLRQVAYQAGLSEGMDYTMSEEGMAVKLPNGRNLFVDGRLPLDHYAAALSAETEAERAGRIAMHNDAVKAHVTYLGSTEFRGRFPVQPDFVVMFVPSESMYETALSADSSLLQRALDSRVAIANPSTLVGLLQSVRVTMEHAKVAENAGQVQKLANDLYEGLQKYTSNLHNVGESLKATTSAYNEALTTLDRDVLSKGRALKGLGVGSGAELSAGSTVELNPREMPRVEYVNPLHIESGQDH